MSVTTLLPLSPNQTSTFIETTSQLDNLTYRNSSPIEEERQLLSATLFHRWTTIAHYKYCFWGAVLFLIALGIVGNILMLVMMGNKKLDSLSYPVYMKCLAVSDSVILITRLITQLQLIFELSKITPEYFCLISFSLRSVVGILSPWLVVGLTLDRYVCVCFPLKREILCTKKKAIIVCSALFVISVLLVSPYPAETEVINGKCTQSDAFKRYSIFVRLTVPSIIPCAVVLVLTILLVIHIQRSIKFRKTFLRSTTEASRGQVDKSTRPLILVSVLAFLTLMPVAVSKVVSNVLTLMNKDRKSMIINDNVRTILYLIYLMNFGQNFYILVASSSNYRAMLRERLVGCSKPRKRQKQPSEVVQKRTTSDPPVSDSIS